MTQDFGYKLKLATILAVAATYQTRAQDAALHAQNTDNQHPRDSVGVLNRQTPESQPDTTTISFEEARQNISQTPVTSAEEVADTLQLEKIKQRLTEIGPKVVRFIAHFENIKMHAYWDKVARKWTIGFGNTTRPDGKPVRRGDKIKDEAELMLYFNDYFLEKVAPSVAKYFPNWLELNEDQQVATCDLFWNAGAGVLANHKEYDLSVQNLNEKQRQEVAQLLQNKNEKVLFAGQAVSLSDIPEWRNLSVPVRTALQPTYSNAHIIKGEAVNPTYSEKFQILNEQQREDVLKLTSMLQVATGFPLDNLGGTQFQSKWNPAQVNDSTIHYQGFVIDQTYTASDVPMWYKLSDTKQEQLGKLLADANSSVVFNGRAIASKEVPALYFTSKEDQRAVRQSLGSADLLVRKPTDNKRKPVLSNLAYELNLYAITKDPVAQERAATRMAAFTRSRGKVVPALQKRANIRAQVFLGQINLNGEGENSINLETVNIGASYSVKVSDLNKPKAICDSIKDCAYGKTYGDTLRAELAQTSNRARQALQSRTRSARRTQTRTTMARTGARGR